VLGGIDEVRLLGFLGRGEEEVYVVIAESELVGERQAVYSRGCHSKREKKV
jgi:hypothetical protein